MLTGVPYFALSEFRHPELVNPRAAMLLSQVRTFFGRPMTLTDDARTPDEAPPGASTTSLHYLGQAFDLRSREWDRETLWNFVGAVYQVSDNLPKHERGIELEIVDSATDKHVHLGFFLDGRANRLLVKPE